MCGVTIIPGVFSRGSSCLLYTSYLACGISGAFQHVTGMEESQLIIAINKNPAAPIFDISDLGIVGNVEVLLPRLIAALK